MEEYVNSIPFLDDRYPVRTVYTDSVDCVIAAFGPGICGNCYEVGDELTVAFSQRFSPDEVSGLFAPKANGKFLLDLRKAVSLELCRMGVELENIHDVGICSYESEAYSSYRRNGPSEFGRQTLSGIVLT